MTEPGSAVMGYLTAMDTLRRMNGMTDDSWQFATIEALFKHYGRAFTPAPLPTGIERGPKRDCFKNAITATAWSAGSNDQWIYVEGYGFNIIPTLHAWVTDKQGELAYDPTWDEGERLYDYLGIAFNPRWAARTMVSTGLYGIFGSDNWELIEGFLKNGIPDEALAFPSDAHREEEHV